MNRREFQLKALGALSLARLAVAAPFDYPWKLGIITDEVDLDLKRTLEKFYPKYGLHWAEIRNVALNGKSTYVYRGASPQHLAEIRQQLDGAGVNVSVLDTAIYKIVLPGTQAADAATETTGSDEYKHQLEDLKRSASAAHTLGTDRLRIFTFKRVANPETVFSRVVEELNRALDVAKQEGVTLVVENEFDCNVGTGTETRKLFETITDRRLMHNWDPGNCYEAGEQPFPKAWDQLDHRRISHIHLKDAAGKDWKPIGAGEIDFKGQFEALKKMLYSGTMSLETHYRNARHDLFSSSVESMNGLVSVLQNV